ncbi:relaxase/mobilization nuclease domain-containing protein, partial [Klebsiella pneumoniae]|nr:relaxase/mobilization nuclease domain-containing protein [Klebsiella pneumoniae]
MEQAIIDRFEAVAFAGLESDQYNILWVRHEHANHHELHFVTPRVELSSGKSLNIRPPGELAKQTF